MHRFILAAALLLPVAAMAQSEPATTIELPLADWKTPDGAVHQGMNSLRSALGTLPHDQVDGFITMLRDCAMSQMPVNGVVIDRGQCSPVTDARRQRAAEQAAAVKNATDKAASDQKATDEKLSKNPP